MHTVTVTTAIELSAAQRKEIEALAAKKLGTKSVSIKEVVDPKVIGGLALQIGSRLYDATVRHELNSIQE